jgi:LysM repeat protein
METRRSLIWGTITLMVVLAVAGCTCQKPMLPGVTPTPVGAQAAPDEGVPDATAIFQTAQANSATAQAATEATVMPTEAAPTEPPPTAVPTEVPTEVSSTAVPAPTTVPSSGTTATYTVQRGDTLYSIARRYGTTVEAIAAANGIANPSRIRVGQTLTIPGATGSPAPAPSGGGTTYVVQRGDILFRIALRYGISYVYLAQYNGIADPSRIYVGQVLKIPPQ